MAEKDFKEFVADLCSDISWKDLLKKWGANIGALIPYANQYFVANMSSFEHDMQLRAIKKVVDAQDDLKNLLQKNFEDFLSVVRKHERATYPFKIFNISQIEDIQGELNWNPEFVKEYLPLREVEDISLDKNILLKGKIGIGKTRSIFRLMKRINIETVIVVTEYVRTLGVDRFENLDFQDEAILIWDDIQNSYEEFLKALPYLKTKNILIVAAIRSIDYEKIEKDVNIRERKMFTEIDLELYQKERMEQFVRLCEKEFQKTLTDSLREALVQKAVIGDRTPLYVASIFVKEKQITENIIDELPADVVGLWAGYFRELTSNEKCFMKALKAAKLGLSSPFKELIEELYSMAFFGESRDLADTIASLKREHWIVEISNCYVCLDAQLECFQFEEVDTENFLNCLFERKLILEYHLQLLLGVGFHYHESGSYDSVIKLMTRALELKPDYAEAYNNSGLSYYEKGKFDLAIKEYDKAIELKTDYAEAYNNRGNAYSRTGEFDLAIKDYDKAIKIKSTYAEAYNNKGNHYYEKGKFDLAIKEYDKAIELKTDYAEAYNNRGNAYSRKGEFEIAIEDYNEAIRLKPDYAEAYNNRGFAYSRKGEFEIAVKDHSEAIELKPDYAEAYNNRGIAHSGRGKFDLAIMDYSKAIELKPDYAEAYNNRGIVCFKKGDIGMALGDFEGCAILFLTKGVIFNAIYHFVQIFKLIFRTESHEILCIECGLIGVFLIDKFEGKINSLEILKKFNYYNLESFLNDIYQQKAHLISPYSRALLHNLYKTHIDENVKRSEFLSKEDIALVDEILKEDTRELFEEIKEDRQKIILRALLDQMTNRVNGEPS